MRERVLAVLGAICLVAVAVLVRSWITGDDGGGGSASPGGRDAELPVVACTSDLAAVCDALAADGTIAADPPTLELADASEAPAEIDGWVTWDPAPQLANFTAGQPAPWSDPLVLGSGTLAVAGTSEDLAAECGGEPTWACVRASSEAGLDVGTGSPTTAEGAARLLPVARPFATDDEADTLESRPLRDLVRGPIDGQASARTMARDLVVRPGRADLVVGPQAVLAEQADTQRGRDRDLQVVVPQPAARASIVVVGRSDAVAAQVHAEVCDRDDPSLDGLAIGVALLGAGADVPCEGDPIGQQLAGFLFRVREELS